MGYWPIVRSRWWDIGQVCFLVINWDEDKAHEHAKKERGQYPAILIEQAWSKEDLLYDSKDAKESKWLFCFLRALESKPVACKINDTCYINWNIKSFPQKRAPCNRKILFLPALKRVLKWFIFANQCWVWSFKSRILLPSSCRFWFLNILQSICLLLVLLWCKPSLIQAYVLNIERSIVKNVWSLTLHRKSFNFSS